MISLSSYNEAAIDNPHAEPVLLITFSFDGLTVRICDRIFGAAGSECIFDDELYEPLLISFDSISSGEINPVSYEVEPTEARIVIDNSVPVGGANQFTRLFANYDPHYVSVDIGLIFNGTTTAADLIDIFSGKIEDIENVQRDQATLILSGYELSVANQFSIEILEADTFAGADPDDIGKMFPQVYGSANKVPFLAIDAGGITSITEAMTDTSPGDSDTLGVSDASTLPSAGAFTIQIDAEQIRIASRSGNTLTLASSSRGYNSTTAAIHSIGAAVAEVQSEYVYAIGHPVKAIDIVYVENVRQTSGFTAYTGQAGDQYDSMARACIVFSTLPILMQQVNIDLGTLAADDQTYSVSLEATNVPMGYVSALDGDGYILNYDNSTTISFPSAPDGSLSDIYVEYSFEFYEFGAPGDNMEFTIDGKLVAAYLDGDLYQYVDSPMRVYKSSWPSSATKTKTWRNGDMKGIALVITSATVYCESDTAAETDAGQEVTLQSTNCPLGAFTSDRAVDSGTSLTFPSAPSGNLSNIRIIVTWTYEQWGDPILTGVPRHLTIGGVNVAHIDADGALTQLMPATFTISQSSWQTSITKSKSRLNEWRRGEALVIRSAYQTAYSDEYTPSTYLSGDIAASGNSVADVVIGGLVSADMQGWQDDGSGTYTGTPSALIENPAHICKHILMHRCGLASAQIDSTYYSAAASNYTSESFVLGFAILQRPNVRQLLNRIAVQSASMEYWAAGVHRLLYLPGTPSEDKTLPANRVDLGQAWVKYTPRVDILNSMSATYARDWSGYSDALEADRAAVVSSDSASIAKYGTMEGETKQLAYITAEAHAQDVLDWMVDDLADPRQVVEFAGGYYLADIEQGDVIDFEYSYDITDEDFLQETFSGMVQEWHLFRVLDKLWRPDAAIQLKAVFCYNKNIVHVPFRSSGIGRGVETFSCSRASSVTGVDNDGQIVTYSSNELSFNRGMLQKNPSSGYTNYHTRSYDVENNWSMQQLETGSNASDPFGTTYGYSLIPTTASAWHCTYKTIAGLTDDTIYTFSCFVKPGTPISGQTDVWAHLAICDKADDIYFAHFNLSQVEKGSATSGVEAYGIDEDAYLEGYYRLWMSLDISNGVQTPYALVGISESDSDTTFAGDGSTTSMWVTGGQMNVGKYPLPIIQTNGATGSVAPEIISSDISGNTALKNILGNGTSIATLTAKVKFFYNATDLIVSQNILACRDSIFSLIYHSSTDNLKSMDGTTEVAKSDTPITYENELLIVVKWNESTSIYKIGYSNDNGETWNMSSETAYDGSYVFGDDLYIGYNGEALFCISNIKFIEYWLDDDKLKNAFD